MVQAKNYSEHTARLIDDEIISIITEMREKVERLLLDNKEKLEKIAEQLLKKETLTNEEIERILEPEKEK